ncbi:MAG TPA: LysR family transcriptional regulator [Sedimenticola sp.]|nr:LysR family transcriptional regulator [Sedimenticola sp.]
MNTELLKTFLEVARTRHFGRAGENLFVTQSAVSARIRQLEETLGVRLFKRSTHGVCLTAAGERMAQHAEAILGAWHRAIQDTAMDEEHSQALTIGGMYSLWDILVQKWVHRLHGQHPGLVLHADAQSHEVLLRRLLDGMLDVAFMFEPAHAAKLLVKEIATIELIMVATSPGLGADEALAGNYVMVDWGTSFAVNHARLFPEMPPAAIHMGLGRIARSYILECGGSCYLARAMTEKYLEDGSLFRVQDAPVIERQAYAVYPADGERLALVQEALALFDE